MSTNGVTARADGGNSRLNSLFNRPPAPGNGRFFVVGQRLLRGVVQLVEQRSPKPRVAGSSPVTPAYHPRPRPAVTNVENSTVDGIRSPVAGGKLAGDRAIGGDRLGDRAWFGTRKGGVRLPGSRRTLPGSLVGPGFGLVAQSGSASPRQGEGRRFESGLVHQDAWKCQSRRCGSTGRAGGSAPRAGSHSHRAFGVWAVAQLAEPRR